MTTSGVDQRLYLVNVTQQGTLVGTHTVEAPDALNAINLVERYYNEPVRLEKVSVEDEVSSQYEVTVANNWHGFMFEAQAIEPVATSLVNLQPERNVISRFHCPQNHFSVQEVGKTSDSSVE